MKAMRLKLEGTKGYEQVEADEDVIALIKLIEKIMVGVEESLQQTMAIVMAERTLYTLFHQMDTSNDNYKSQFEEYATVMEAYCGGVRVPQILVDTKLKEFYPSVSDVTTADSGQRTAAEVLAIEHYIACMMLVGEKDMRFGGMKDDLFNSYLLGGDK